MNTISRCLLATSALLAFQGLAGPVELLSDKGPGFPASTTASGISFSGVLDAAGDLVVFASSANNLELDHKSALRTDIFSYRNSDGAIARLTAPDGGGTGASATSIPVGISGDTLLFLSDAPDLLGSPAGVFGADQELYAQSLIDGSRRLLSKGAIDGTPAVGGVFSAVLAEGGRYVFFESAANNITGSQIGGTAQIYRIDLQSGDLPDLVSSATNAPLTTKNPAVSADGNVIAYILNNDGASDSPASTVVVKNMTNGITKPILVGGSTNRVYATDVQLSADGRYLAFRRHGSRIAAENGVYWIDLLTNTNAYCSASLPDNFDGDTYPFGSIAMFPDGRTIAFEGLTSSLDQTERIWFWSADSSRATGFDGMLMTVPPVSTEPPDSALPVISPDGKSVAFISYSGLTPSVTQGGPNLYIRSLPSGQTTLASHGPDGEPAVVDPNVISFTFSPDGLQLEIETDSPGLVANDLNDTVDVFLYDIASDRIRAASAAGMGLMDVSPDQSSSIQSQCLSHDGRYVVFESAASDLVTNAPGGNPNVYAKDRLLNMTTLVSVNTDGESTADSASSAPLMTPDGRFVLFFSSATNLTAEAAPKRVNVFLRNMQAGSTELISGINAVDTGTSAISTAAMSDDARYITLGLTAGTELIDRNTKTVSKIGGPPNPALPQISRDGSAIAFAQVPNIGVLTVSSDVTSFFNVASVGILDKQHIGVSSNGAKIAVHGASGFAVINTSANSVQAFTNGPAVRLHDWILSPDGSEIIYSAHGAAIGAPLNNQLYKLNTADGTVAPLSTNYFGMPANGSSINAAVSDDGRFVTFKSDSSDLVSFDNNGTQDIFVRDMVTGGLALVSQTPSGASGNDRSLETFISADGTFIAFTSAASDLTMGAYDGLPNLFGWTVSIPLPDSDSDGLPDQWELQFFGNLAQGPNDDFDHDGASNLDEFLAHTDPTNPSSILKLNIAGIVNGNINLAWQTALGLQYQVQYGDNIGKVAWQNIGDSVLGSGSGAAFQAPLAGAGARLYRLVASPSP